MLRKIYHCLPATLVLALALLGCSSDPPRYEAIARIGFSQDSVDLAWEVSFLRAQRFLQVVFEQLPESDLRRLAAGNTGNLSADDKHQLFRQFTSHASARQEAQSRHIEVCFWHTNAEFSADMANRIAALYLGVKVGKAHLIDNAFPPKLPVKE